MDQQKEAPGFVLSSMVKQVDEAVFLTIKDFKENKFTGGIKTYGLKDNGVGYVYDANNKKLIPDDVKVKLDAIKNKLVSGEIKVDTK